jgi:tetrahydromethanopterin S-methyltransferase subunit B
VASANINMNVSIASKRESPLLIELDRLEKSIEGLAIGVQRLGNQLDPALRPESPPTRGNDIDASGTVRSVVVNRLCNLADRIMDIDRHVESLNERSDV